MSNLIRSRKTRVSTVLATAAVSLGIMAGPAAAQNQGQQNGLVNIAVVDVLNNNQVAVQVPIGVAANVCGVNVGIIQENRNSPLAADCASSTDPSANATFDQLPPGIQKKNPNPTVLGPAL